MSSSRAWASNCRGIGAILTREDLRFRGCILTVTVEREAGRWFACVTVECKAPEACPGTELIGVDVGGRKIAACSDGNNVSGPQGPAAPVGQDTALQKTSGSPDEGQRPATLHAAQAAESYLPGRMSPRRRATPGSK